MTLLMQQAYSVPCEMIMSNHVCVFHLMWPVENIIDTADENRNARLIPDQTDNAADVRSKAPCRQSLVRVMMPLGTVSPLPHTSFCNQTFAFSVLLQNGIAGIIANIPNHLLLLCRMQM